MWVISSYLVRKQTKSVLIGSKNQEKKAKKWMVSSYFVRKQKQVYWRKKSIKNVAGSG